MVTTSSTPATLFLSMHGGGFLPYAPDPITPALSMPMLPMGNVRGRKITPTPYT
jgi:hypothetical protein